MQHRSWLTPAETRLAGLLFVLTVLGGLVRWGEHLSPEVERWLIEAGGPVPDAAPAAPPGDSLAVPAPPAAAAAAAGSGPEPAGLREVPPDRGVEAGGVDPNAAGLAALVRLPGVGPALARRILEDRERNGPYRRPEDLLRVRGIGPATLDKMRPGLRF